MDKIKEDLIKTLKLKDEDIQRIEVKFDDSKVSSISIDYAVSEEAKKMGFAEGIKADG